ncbi:hypothetical protein IMY05_001G0225300 [Salix suchowensis]|nr:hypothetical protein IMY05_001G0225300 [Salix suchowensis]
MILFYHMVQVGLTDFNFQSFICSPKSSLRSSHQSSPNFFSSQFTDGTVWPADLLPSCSHSSLLRIVLSSPFLSNRSRNNSVAVW